MDRDNEPREFHEQSMEVSELSGRLSDTISKLLTLSYSLDETVRYDAVEALGDAGAREVVERMRDGLNDPDELVRVSCVESLGYFRDRNSTEIVRDRLKDDSSLVRGSAAITLAMIGDKASTQAIYTALERATHDEERKDYYLSLHMLGESGFLCRVLDGLFHPFHRIRHATANRIDLVLSLDNMEFIQTLLRTALERKENLEAASNSSLSNALEYVTEWMQERERQDRFAWTGETPNDG